MELHLGGSANAELHTTIAEGPQVEPRLTRMNAIVEPFFGGVLQLRTIVSKTYTIEKPPNVKFLQFNKIKIE